MTDLLTDEAASLRMMAEKASATYVKYFELLDRTGWRGNDPYGAKTVNGLVERLSDLFGGRVKTTSNKSTISGLKSNDKILTKPITGDSVTVLFANYAEAARGLADMEELHKLAVKVRPSVGLTFSSSSGANLDAAFHKDVHKALVAAELLQNKYAAALVGYRPENNVFQANDSDIDGFAKKLSEAQEIYAKFLERNRGQLVVDMYVRILSIGLEIPSLVKPILHELEEIKTSVIASDEVEGLASNRRNGIQQLLLCYNMRPVTNVLTSPTSSSQPVTNVLTSPTSSSQPATNVLTSPTSSSQPVTNVLTSQPIGDSVCGLVDLFAMHSVRLSGRSKVDVVEASKALCKLMSSASSEYKYGVLIINRILDDPVTYRLPKSLGRDVGPSVQNIAESVSIVQLDASDANGRVPAGITKLNCENGAHRDYYFVIDVLAPGAYRWLSPYGNLDKIPARLLNSVGGGATAVVSSARVHGYNALLAGEIFKQMDDPLVGQAEVKPDTYWKNLRGRVLEQVYARLGSRKADPLRLADLITSVVVEQLQTEMMDVKVTPIQQRQYLAEMQVSVEASRVELEHKLVSLLSSYGKSVSRDDVRKTLDYVLTSKSNLYKAMEIKNQVLSSTLLHSRFNTEFD